MTRRCLATVLLILLAAPPISAASAGAATDPSAFIDQLGRRALEALNTNLAPEVRRAHFRELFRQNFDAPRIARFVLGRYWQLASDAERREFLTLFEDYVVFAYSSRLSEYSGEVFRVGGSRADGDAVIVASEILRPGGNPPLKVDWRLVGESGGLKIADVVVDGISMAVTQRSEFAAVIQRNGGQVEGLLTAMREKTAGAGH